MNRVTDCENQCQRPNGFICTRNCKIAEEMEALDSRDELLWEALEALSDTLRALGVFTPNAQIPGNYGDAIIVLHKIESHFGVDSETKPEKVWCEGCDNHVHKDDPCYIVCGGQR